MTYRLSLRKQASGGKAWVSKGKKPGNWITFDGVSHAANSGNKTVYWDLEPGVYCYGETWYGKSTRQIIEITEDGKMKVIG